MIEVKWEGLKLKGNGVVIAEVKPHMQGTFKVMYADRPDLGPSQLGYATEDKARGSCEKNFGVALT